MHRRTVLQSMSLPLLVMAGCKTRGPLAPLNKLSMLPVGNLDRHYIDVRDIVSRATPTAELGSNSPLVMDQQDSARFEQAMSRLGLKIHESAQVGIIDRLKAAGVALNRVETAAVGSQTRDTGQYAAVALAGGAGAVLDVFFDAQGYRPIVSANALTPEVYAEMYVYSAVNNGNIGGARYSFDYRAFPDDPRHVQCDRAELYDSLEALMADLPGAGKAIERGAMALVDPIVKDILSLYKGIDLV